MRLTEHFGLLRAHAGALTLSMSALVAAVLNVRRLTLVVLQLICEPKDGASRRPSVAVEGLILSREPYRLIVLTVMATELGSVVLAELSHVAVLGLVPGSPDSVEARAIRVSLRVKVRLLSGAFLVSEGVAVGQVPLAPETVDRAL